MDASPLLLFAVFVFDTSALSTTIKVQIKINTSFIVVFVSTRTASPHDVALKVVGVN